MINDVMWAFSWWAGYLQTAGRQNLNDGSIHSEVLVQRLLNAAYGWQLTSANSVRANHPFVDLVDATNELAVQVTSRPDSRKIQKTLDGIAEARDNNDLAKVELVDKKALMSPYNRLIVFSPVRKQDRYTLTVPASAPFDWRADVHDTDDIVDLLNKSAGDDVLRAVHAVVQGGFPELFQSQQALNDEKRRAIRAALTEFDRDVLQAPALKEDPVLMLKSLREARIGIQRNGTLQIPDGEVVSAFREVQRLIRECEYTIREKYRYIYEAASAITGQQVGAPALNFQGSDRGDSIQLMMDLRAPLEQQFRRVGAVLQSI